MANTLDIRRRIKSIRNIGQLTKAMQMVAASKMRKAQERMRAARLYAEKIRSLAANLAQETPEYKHPFMAERAEVKRIGYIIVSSDRGLCGGLNSSMFRKLLADMREWQGKGVEIDVVCIGQKAATFFRRLKVTMTGSVTHLGDKPHLDPSPYRLRR